jgi:hypothetical protein
MENLVCLYAISLTNCRSSLVHKLVATLNNDNLFCATIAQVKNFLSLLLKKTSFFDLVMALGTSLERLPFNKWHVCHAPG